ncbi:hypothetical protein [Allosediminivita pacifica]|uniref:Uncharacterized protein n=1 Tax=Allosediminivita pacifica TaxID=1267769 RepID=A0A2T6AD69_9RHOB|nr:hypothetical protein [Allosediminivita pacifica]PTX41763.1 hypothetical protein C8N44_12729 [Allosediminivita pacifica]GGB22721.1 hypothetical protein GCM10011324_35930 [Allosediminivita pacifica]
MFKLFSFRRRPDNVARQSLSRLLSDPHMRRDIGLPNIDHSSLQMGRQMNHIRGWL